MPNYIPEDHPSIIARLRDGLDIDPDDVADCVAVGVLLFILLAAMLALGAFALWGIATIFSVNGPLALVIFGVVLLLIRIVWRVVRP